MSPARLESFSLGGRDYYGGAPEPFLRWLLARPRRARAIHVANVHTHVSAFWDRELALAQEEADLLLPDGRPLSLAAKLLGRWSARQLRGPDLMVSACEWGRAKGTRHFFYGGADGVAKAVAQRMKALAPGLKVAGAESPPFRPVSEAELRTLASRLRRLKVDLLWVGLGAPKQEKLMRRLALEGVPCAMLGVGAAFDYYAGTKPEAPKWMQAAALEWAFRLAQEPRRLFGRYLSTNPLFLGCLALEIYGLAWALRQPALERLLRVGCFLAAGVGLAQGHSSALFLLALPLLLGPLLPSARNDKA